MTETMNLEMLIIEFMKFLVKIVCDYESVLQDSMSYGNLISYVDLPSADAFQKYLYFHSLQNWDVRNHIAC